TRIDCENPARRWLGRRPDPYRASCQLASQTNSLFHLQEYYKVGIGSRSEFACAVQSTQFLRMKASHGMAIAGAGLVLTLPVLILGVPFLSDDAGFHAVWYTHFSHQLWAGDLYPRWLAGMNGGLGSPVFFFYPPLPYFLTSILRPFFRSDPQGWHQLGVSASLALIASGF